MPSPTTIVVLVLASIITNCYGELTDAIKVQGNENRIYQGSFAEESFPFYVAIVIKKQEANNFTIFCGGSLIDNQSVLTTAHCNDGMRERMRYGAKFMAYFAPKQISTFKGKKIPINDPKSLINHPDFDDWMFNSDIGIIRLPEPIKLGSRYSSICIGKTELTNQNVTLTGFGNYDCVNPSDSLRYATGSTVKCSVPEAQNNTVCANLKNDKNEYAMNGVHDNGGPLVNKFRQQGSHNKIFAQVGIAALSYADILAECPHPEYPGLYTVPEKYIKFLQKYSKAKMCVY